MNNVFKKVLFLLTVISAYFVYDYKNVYATELSDAEKISIINHIDDSVDSIDVRFDENIPYVKLDDIYGFMSPNKITISKKDDGIYEVTTEGGKATINTTMDYLYSDNLGAFIEIPEEEVESPIVVKNYDTQFIGDSISKNIDFKKYEIDIIGDGKSIWLPVQIAFDMFLYPGFYDGENINIYDHMTAVGLLNNLDEYDEIISKFFINDKRLNNNIKVSYNELCFMFDYYYGYPERSILSESIKNYGLDYTLEHFDDDTKQIKNWLLSDSIDDYYLGLAALDAYLYDGGHTALSNIVAAHIGFLGVMDLEEKLEDIKQFKYKNKTENNHTSNEIDINENRDLALKDDNYIEKGDTALYAFDSFDYDNDGWKKYYEEKGEYPNDTLGGILRALDRASQNKNIKYFVFDISKNGGGLGSLAPIIMDFLGYDNALQYRDTLSNLIEKNIVDTDINFDGIYDEKDKISKYNFNYGVLTSNLTFSTANIFASLAKENNFMIIGEQSGGGACSLSILFTDESLLYSISSTKHIVNNEGSSIDKGIAVDEYLVGKKELFGEDVNDYSKYYDLDNLSSLLNEYYKAKEKEVTVEKIENNFMGTNIFNTSEEISNLIPLTDEETKALKNGTNLFVFVEAIDASSLISTDDKIIIENNLDNNSRIGMYLDINLYKKIDGKDKIKVLETPNKLKISIEIPENLIRSNRKFYIIRLHNGSATKIIPTLNENILTFETDKFSIYALAYIDAGETKIDTEIAPTSNKNSNPKTGDGITYMVIVLTLSIVGLATTSIFVKKDKVF